MKLTMKNVIMSIVSGFVVLGGPWVQSAMAETVVIVDVQANSGPPASQYTSTIGATDTGVFLGNNYELQIAYTGLATYGYEGAGCVGYPETDGTGNTYLNGVFCGRKFDASSMDQQYIGELLYAVDCNGDGVVSWQPVSASRFYPNIGGYFGCVGELFLLYNDVPGLYSDNTGFYQVQIESGPGGTRTPLGDPPPDPGTDPPPDPGTVGILN